MIKRLIQTMIVLGLMGGSELYIANPGFGLIELIPDNTPLIGNLDEAAAAALFLNCLRYFGIDLTAMFRRSEPGAVEPAKSRDIIET